MKKTLSIFSTIALLTLTGCIGSKQMQREISQMRSSLFYDLTSIQYEGIIRDSIYMDLIDFSNIEYYTAIKRKGGYIVPLLLVNFQGNNFTFTLGEYSLTQTYREFLTEAMLAECNSSTRFQLIDNKDATHHANEGYHLRLKILQNETLGKIRASSFLILLPLQDMDSVEGESNKVKPSTTQLSIQVCLEHDGTPMFEKVYQVTHTQNENNWKYPDTYEANRACLDDMANSLSQATKKIVENISQELDMIIEGRSFSNEE